MIKRESDEEIFKKNRRRAGENNMCNFDYLNEAMGSRKNLIKGMIDVFLVQAPKDLQNIREAITKSDYALLKSSAHSMRSSVSIMGISVLVPVLLEMEELGGTLPSPGVKQLEKLKELNSTLEITCRQAIGEIEKERYNFD